MRQAAGAAHALTGHTLHLMASSLDGHCSHLHRDRTAVYSTFWHIQIILGEELDETGGDGGGFGSKADIQAPSSDVRFTPESGHQN